MHHLGLTAMEVQFIKVNPLTRVVLDEEVGKLPKDLLLSLPVVVGGTSGDTDMPTYEAFHQPLRRRQQLTTLTWSLAKDFADLTQTKDLARALDVDLTLHAPYYVDFFGSAESRTRSIRQIQWASVLADGLGARMTVTHLGFYGSGDRTESVADLTRIAGELSDWLKTYTKGNVRLGVELSGHPDVFGSRDEVLELAHQVKGIVPVLNLPHLAARERTPFEDAAQLRPIIDQFVEASGGNLYLNFSGVEIYGAGEFRLTPIKRGQVRFDTLAEILGEREYDVTVISSSPLLEHDAMYMKLLYERALAKRWAKKRAHPLPGTAVAAGGPVAPTKTPAKPVAKKLPPTSVKRPMALTAKGRSSGGSRDRRRAH
ncbi:MAG: TIM barrel protein [Thermoplasmata archaeon]|nr:TIM barrel protein [Thermoplasmata archaeon]